MNTRRTTDGSFHQSKYASSPEFQHGLYSGGVVKRCAVLDNMADIDLIWWLQWISKSGSGLAGLAEDLIQKFGDRLGTRKMVQIGKNAAGNFTPDEVKEIRRELPQIPRREFPLKGEVDRDLRGISLQIQRDEESLKLQNDLSWDEIQTIQRRSREHAVDLARENEKASQYPTSYPVSSFLQLCSNAALNLDVSGCSELERILRDLCLDPKSSMTEGPWYFADLINVLRLYRQQWIQSRPPIANTAVVKEVEAGLNYTLEQRSQGGFLTLMMGGPSVGIRYAVQSWCERQAGCARFVEAPPSNDESSFFKAIARALGLGKYTGLKNSQIRDRVETVLQTWDVVLVLGSAQNLWPLANLREAYPKRLAWLLDQISKGVTVALISNPQFFMQRRTCEKVGWDSPALRDRINDFVFLPDRLEVQDLASVAGIMFPEAGERIATAIAIFARGTNGFISSLESVGKRATSLARREGRKERTKDDFKKALKIESRSADALRATIEGKKPAEVIPPTEPMDDIEIPDRNRIHFQGQVLTEDK